MNDPTDEEIDKAIEVMHMPVNSHHGILCRAVVALRRQRAERDAATATLAWFVKREPMVRALVGAVEDGMRVETVEWRTLVDWEEHNSSREGDPNADR